MIPGTTAALIGFLFFVAPGLVWELQRERRRPPRADSTFREVSRVALASVAFTSSAIVLLAFVRASSGAFVDPAAWLRHGDRYLADEYQIVAATAVTELVVACGLALLLSRPWRPATHRPEPALITLLGTTIEGTVRRVSVRLDDGMTYTGNFSRLDHGPRADAYLELQPPLKWVRAEESGDVEPDFQRLAVPMEHVCDVFVEWRSVDSPDESESTT